MRTRWLVVALLAVVGTSTPAIAEGDAATHERMARESGALITDGKGHYIAFAVDDPYQSIENHVVGKEAVWYGDGKTFYELHVTYAHDGDASHWHFRDMRVGLETRFSTLELGKTGSIMHCDDRSTSVTRVPDKDARALLAKAVFKPALNQRWAFVLGREGTTYYYVDAPSEQKARTTVRLFIGKRGGMKAMKVTHVDSDADGTVITTAKGSLRSTRALRGDRDPKASDQTLMWTPKGGKPISLPDLDSVKNGKLIFSDLGIYPAKLGLPCDEM